jgi:hypothetical protein
MINFRFVYSLLLLLLIILNSCKKNSPNFNQNENLLTKESRKVVSIRQNINNSGWVNIFSTLSTCKKDNLTFLNLTIPLIRMKGLQSVMPPIHNHIIMEHGRFQVMEKKYQQLMMPALVVQWISISWTIQIL